MYAPLALLKAEAELIENNLSTKERRGEGTKENNRTASRFLPYLDRNMTAISVTRSQFSVSNNVERFFA